MIRKKDSSEIGLPYNMNLTPKQERFIQEYLIDFNATQAAVRAGYSQKTARQQGYENLTKPYIQTKLRDSIKKRSDRTEIDADTVLKESAQIALANIVPAFTEDNTLKGIHDIPENLRRAISGVEILEVFTGTGKNRKLTGYTKKIKFWSKDKHIELLMRHLGLFLESNRQQGETLAMGIHRAYEAMKEE